jgi:hypothetical protein
VASHGFPFELGSPEDIFIRRAVCRSNTLFKASVKDISGFTTGLKGEESEARELSEIDEGFIG